jgi:hypothetical protein
MSLLSDYNQRIEYFKNIKQNLDKYVIGSHDAHTEVRGKLGYLMKHLKESEHNDEVVDELLEKIHKEMKLNYELEIFKNEYNFYLELLIKRQVTIRTSQRQWFNKLSNVGTLNKYQWNHWGSYQQFLFGKYVVDALNSHFNKKLHPIWGCLLSPTGGIVGQGNDEVISGIYSHFACMHAYPHDASGYIYNYHKLGNSGYNYLDTWMTLFPKNKGMSCQVAGLNFWRKMCN